MNTRKKFLLFDCFCAILICFPVLLSPHSRMLGSEKVDVWNHSWGGFWWAHSLSNGNLPWKTDLLVWPNGGVLWFIDPILAFLSTPFALFSTSLGYNITCFLYVMFASWCIRFFARSLGAFTAGEILASGAFACSGWMISELHNGISEACNIGPAALALGWCTYARLRNEYREWIYTGLSLALCFLASPYLGLGTSLVVAIYSLPYLKKAWLGAVVGIFLSLPSVLTMRNQLEHADAIIKKPEGMNEFLALHNAVDPRTFIAPLGFQSRDLSHEGFVHTLYLGLVALPLALFFLRKRPLLLIALLASLLGSLGPFLYLGDSWLIINNHKIGLPWYYVQQLIPTLAITHPLRIGVPALAIVAACAGAALRENRLYSLQYYIIGAVFLDNLLLCGAPWPLHTADATIPAIYEEIAQDQRSIAVLDLPTDSGSTMETSRYLYWQSSHHKPIPYGPDVRASTSSLLQYHSFRYLASLCTRRKDEQLALGLRNAKEIPPTDLINANIGWIVLHKNIDPKATKELLPFLTRTLGEGVEIGDSVRWRLE